MSEIQITFQDLDLGGKPAKVVNFVGQLDETNVDHEAKQIYQIIMEMAMPILLLDFSGLDYMNSKSIGYVTDWFTKVSEKAGTLCIVSPKQNILDILKVVGITQIVTVYNSMDEAKAALGGANAAPVASTPVTPAPAAPVAPAPAAPVAPAPAATSTTVSTASPETPAAPAA